MKKLLLILACILCFSFIFYNSSQNTNTSNARSYHYTNDLRNLYRKLKGESKKNYNTLPANQRDEKINIFIRKNAHAFEYLLLAIIVTIVLFSFGLKGKNAVVYIWFICLFYAVLDEFHQLYVPGRTSQVSDVMIDFLGANIGMWISYFVYYVILRRKHNKN
ncbi:MULTISPECIES: VanZ family protein [Clostridium]|uniref:VanZ family protein n=1 Tax=Clostridium TaxID=1485 RepID=UPI00082595C5|nr:MULTISPECIES: VanZ family protein [Clostridium]PJI08931.1 teicoplanin resistance protein VanZ [Clostridium sp. CT7]